jgi:mannose-1-phosphate guanylyltransferase
MKAFILAAGNGTRLRPLTDTLPKCLLPIGGKPMLSILLENCRVGGVEEVLINVHAHAAKIRDFVSRNNGHVRIHIVQEEQLLGSAGTLAANRSFVREEETFLVHYGDVLTSAPLEQMIACHRRKNMPATIGVHQVPDPERCGIVEIDDHNIVRSFVEKPAAPVSHWAFSGIMVASPQILDLVPARRPADLGFDVLPQLAGRMTAHPISEFLMDIGTLENYRAAQSFWSGMAAGGA